MYDSIYSSIDAYNKSVSSEIVSDGDKIQILPILDFVTNFVEIKGNIFRPGKYEYDKHTTLEKLIQSAQGLKPNTYKNRIEIYRLEDNKTEPTIHAYSLNDQIANINLKEFDVIRIFSLDEVSEKSSITISGAVQNPGNYTLFNDMKLVDILFKATLNENANINEIELMRKKQNGKYKLLVFNLIEDKIKTESFKLLKDDHIFIKTSFDLQDAKKVSLLGEVTFPGKYPFEEGETLFSVLKDLTFLQTKLLFKVCIFLENQEKNSNFSKITCK